MTGEGPHPEDEYGTGVDTGAVLRPDAVVLGDEDLIPPRNLVRPPPNCFTHELVFDEPYRFDRPERPREADGVLRAGTRVTLLVQGDDLCRVVDGTGLSVDVRRASLRELPSE
jgi:hypothetical protein